MELQHGAVSAPIQSWVPARFENSPNALNWAGRQIYGATWDQILAALEARVARVRRSRGVSHHSDDGVAAARQYFDKLREAEDRFFTELVEDRAKGFEFNPNSGPTEIQRYYWASDAGRATFKTGRKDGRLVGFILPGAPDRVASHVPASPDRLRGYAIADAPMIEKMRGLVSSGAARSYHAASLMLAQEASGSGTVESRAKRLACPR